MAAGVVGGLAAHVGVLDLEAEQGAVGAHAQLVALHALIEEDVSRRVGDARGVEHQGAVQHDAVFLGEQREDALLLLCQQGATSYIQHSHDIDGHSFKGC